MTSAARLATLGLVFCGVSLAGAAPARPRLCFDAAGLQRLRELVKQTAPCVYGFAPADGWAAVKARADSLLAAPTYSYTVQIPAKNGEHEGWQWSYTLSSTPPPRHDESDHYPPWTAMFQERSDSLSTRLKHFSLAYALTGEAKYCEAAKAIALPICAWPYWTDPSYGGGLSACLDTGHATQNIALFYDWCHDALTPAERETIQTALIERGVLPIREQLTKLDPYHNFWAVINTGFGTAAIALLGEDPRTEGWVDEAIENTKRQFDRQGADGGSFEGPMYGTYAADMLAQLIFALDSAKIPHRLRSHPFLATLSRFAVNGMSPDLKGQPVFGDGGWGAGYPITMATLAAAGDEAARWYLVASGHLSGVDSINELLFQGPLLAAKMLPEVPAWRGDDVFEDIGYAFLRDDRPGAPFLAFKCGPPTEKVGHNHYDQNSFQITAHGQPVAADPGYRSYFDPPKRRYTTSSFGHNTMVLGLDEAYLENQTPTQAGHDQINLNGGRITEFLPSEGIGLLCGEAAAAYNSADQTVLSRFQRRIVQLPGNGYLLVDDLAAPQPTAMSWLLHGPAGSKAAGQGTTGSVAHPQALLETALYTPGGVTWSGGIYPGAEPYGPYLAATAQPAATRRFVSVLIPRRNNELVGNPGFEDQLAGWTPRNTDNQGPNHTASTDMPHSGQYCGRIAGAGYLYSSRFVLPAGSKLTARCWYRTEGATKGASFTIYFWPASGNATSSKQVTELVSEDQWQEAVVEATVPDDAVTVSVAFNYFDTGVGYVDDVSVTPEQPVEASAPAAVTPLGEAAADGVVVTVDGRQHHVAFGQAGKIDSDGELAVVSVDPDGKLTDLLLLRGSRIAYGGQEVLQTARAVTVSAHRGPQGWVTTIREDLAPHAAAIEAEAVGLRLSVE